MVVAILVGLVVLAYVFFRWKINSDKRSMENLKSEKMRLQMEALAAEKKALRKKAEEKAKKEKVEKPKEPPKKKDEFDDGEILQF